MMLNTQLMLVIFDGFSVVVRVIDADDGGSISMASKDHGCYFVGVVTPFVSLNYSQLISDPINSVEYGTCMLMVPH